MWALTITTGSYQKAYAQIITEDCPVQYDIIYYLLAKWSILNNTTLSLHCVMWITEWQRHRAKMAEGALRWRRTEPRWPTWWIILQTSKKSVPFFTLFQCNKRWVVTTFIKDDESLNWSESFPWYVLVVSQFSWALSQLKVNVQGYTRSLLFIL